MSYATPAQFLERYDARDIGDLCNDDGQQVSRIDLLADTKLQAALDDASGAIDAALLAGGRYTAADLVGLTGFSLSFLIRITCDIALANIWGRRPLYRFEERKACMDAAEAHLKQLRLGENVFNVAANILAGAPTIDGPTTVQYDALNLVRDRTRNYYPARHLPNDR